MSIIQAELTTAYVPDRVGAEQRELPAMPHLVKPLSGRLFYAISTGGTLAFQHSSHPFFRTIGQTIIAVGYVAGTVFALAEALTLLGIGLTVDLIHHATNRRFALLNTISLHAHSMSIHSATIVILQVLLLYKQAFSEYHSFNLLLAHTVHHISYPLLCFAGRVEQDYVLSSIKSFIQDGALLEILYSLRRDFRPDVSESEFRQRLNERSLQAFLHHYPEHRIPFQNRNIFSIFDQEHRERWRRLVSDFVDFQFQELPAVEVEIGNNRNRDYQNKLCGYIKSAFKEIYRDDTLVNYVEGGRDAFDGFYPSIFVPLARYAELLELEDEEILCPYNEEMMVRYSLIESCRNRLRHGFNREAVVRSLLTGETTTSLEQDIGGLGGELHQGTLLTKSTFNINLGPNGRSDVKLFIKACQEALQELAAN